MSDAETQAERPGRRRRRRRSTMTGAVGRGLIQGGLLNWSDEIFGPEWRAELEADASQRPLAFQAGNLVGAGLWGGALSATIGRSALAHATGTQYARNAAIIDGVVGAGMGMGGYDPSKDETAVDRLSGAALGSATGAVTAGLLPAVLARGGYVGQAIDNSPVLVNRATFGAAGSPYRLNPDRMLTRGGRYTDEILDEALARDETAARASGLVPPGLNRNGDTFRPVNTQGPNTQSLFEMALESPAAQSRYRDYVAREGADRSQVFMNRLRMNDQPVPRSAAAPKDEEAQAFLAAVDDEMVHPAWVREARKLTPEKREEVARGLVAKIQDEMAAADPRAQTVLAQRLAPRGDLRQKLQALGVQDAGSWMQTSQMARAGIPLDPNAPAISRAMDPAPPRNARFTTDADQEMATAGREAGWGLNRRGPVVGENPPARLDDETAAQIMELMLSPRRQVYQPPSTTTDPLLALQDLPGMRWRNPWVNGAINADSAEAAYIAGKPAAAFAEQTLHGDGLVPFVFSSEYRARAEAERRAAGSGRWDMY